VIGTLRYVRRAQLRTAKMENAGVVSGTAPLRNAPFLWIGSSSPRRSRRPIAECIDLMCSSSRHPHCTCAWAIVYQATDRVNGDEAVIHNAKRESCQPSSSCCPPPTQPVHHTPHNTRDTHTHTTLLTSHTDRPIVCLAGLKRDLHRLVVGDEGHRPRC
jgi:hypothetical protein